MNKRWFLSRDGQDFLKLVAEYLKSSVPESSPADLSDSTGDPDADWELVKSDYIQAVRFVLVGELKTAAEQLPFKDKLDEVYKPRFVDGYDDLPSIGLVRLQAASLGTITTLMYRLHTGEIGDYSPALPDAPFTEYYLEWARDFVGFFMFGHTRYSIEALQRKSRAKVANPLGEEFENGCALC